MNAPITNQPTNKVRFAMVFSSVLSAIIMAANSRAIAQKLEYTFQKRDSTSLLVTVLFSGDKSGNTMLHLPNEWAGQQKLYKSVSRLTSLSKDVVVTTTEKPEEYMIKYTPGKLVRFSYTLSKDWSGTLRYPFYFRPVILNDFFFFEGYSGLVSPDLPDTAQLSCKITYEGFPKGCFFGNSFFARESTHRFKASFHDFRNSFFCAGNFRVRIVEVNGHKIVMAVTGKFLFTDEDAFSSISKIIIAERKFWTDETSPYFFAALLPLTDPGTTGGTAHHNSFYMVQSVGLNISQGFMPVLSHEYFHNWIGQGLSMPQPEEAYKWFSEGFTDYYSLKILKLTDAISDEDFIAKMNQNIKEYYLSPYFKTDNQELVGKYWENPTLKVLSYRRGLTIAFMLDSKISGKKEYSLDNLMRNLYEQSKPQLLFSKVRLDSLIVKYADKPTLAAVDSACDGKNGALTRNLLGSKVYKTGNLTISKIFDMGFDFEASKKVKKIIGLKPGSNAEKAGLAENMEITNEFSIWNNNTDKPAKVRVLRDGEQAWITYIPVADVNIQIPQIITGSNK